MTLVIDSPAGEPAEALAPPPAGWFLELSAGDDGAGEFDDFDEEDFDDEFDDDFEEELEDEYDLKEFEEITEEDLQENDSDLPLDADFVDEDEDGEPGGGKEAEEEPEAE